MGMWRVSKRGNPSGIRSARSLDPSKLILADSWSDKYDPSLEECNPRKRKYTALGYTVHSRSRPLIGA